MMEHKHAEPINKWKFVTKGERESKSKKGACNQYQSNDGIWFFFPSHSPHIYCPKMMIETTLDCTAIIALEHIM